MNTVVAICLLACVSLTYGEISSSIAGSTNNQYEVFARNLLMRLLEEDTRSSADGAVLGGEVRKREELVQSDLLLQEETRFASELESLEQTLENTKRMWEWAGMDCKKYGSRCVDRTTPSRCCKTSSVENVSDTCKGETGCCISIGLKTIYESCKPKIP
ncbi:unnamed protein product [Owenia fusiformis]|uniref:Uncharacterized protein n=1 Tax=Owenia fusiformis TaxID=6347 RepID=A0A8J1UNZ2_OWEFU|nr:unnamed protein product [Owenia fusiformis]